jgi:hypothetical protein
MARYDLYGLVVESEFGLPAHAARDGEVPDLAIALGERREVPDVAPEGELVAHARWGDRGYAAARSREGDLLFRFYRTCDLEFSAGLARASLHLAPGVELDLAKTLLCGTVLSLVLLLRGECVLHSSAVAIRGNALAFVGETGSGKSTLAALGCIRGALLVTDDVLVLDLSTVPPRCRLGPRELRLRDNASELVERVHAAPARRTADERWSLAPRAELGAEPSLAALIFPEPSRAVTAPELRPLRGRECLIRLLRAPRLGGLRETRALAAQFAAFAQVARHVPAFAATLPWGPPFDEHALDTVLELAAARPGAPPAAVAK